MRAIRQISVILFLSLGFHVNVDAQFLMPVKASLGNFFRIGIKGGVNIASLKTDGIVSYNGTSISNRIQESLATRQSYVGGIYARIGRTLFIEPELLISAKGGSLNLLNAVTNQSVVNVSYTNLDVPVLLGIRWKFFHIMAGSVASYTLTADNQLNDLMKQITQKLGGTLGQVVSRASYSYQVGGGIDLLGLTFDVRYEGNLSTLSNAIPIPEGVTFSPKMNLFHVTLGYKLF